MQLKLLLLGIQKTASEYREPFIGGGSVAFYTTQAYPDVPIWINDLYVPLV
jgi:site-specific DNA-adenine methylase